MFDLLSREGHSGGPEALELEELKLHEETQPNPFPSPQTVGPLLREACIQLPSIRGCFLTHLAHLETAVLVSREAFLGRNPWIGSHLFPELSGPSLPSDWPFFPLVSLYERTAVSGGGGLAVEELPPGALQTVIHCLQWLLLLEVWREDALKVHEQGLFLPGRFDPMFTDNNILLNLAFCSGDPPCGQTRPSVLHVPVFQ